MDTVTATFSIPDWIEQGLKDGNYVRIGGVIRDAQGKQLVAMLREAAPNLTQAASLLSQVGSVASILNLAVSVIEIQAIAQLGISFHDWLKLAPSEDKPDGAELMYIIPDKPLDVAFAS